MARKERDVETFSLSFLDVICCGFGAVILLLVITKIYEPFTIEEGKRNLEGLVALLQEELFEIRGETVVLNRDLEAVTESLSEKKDKIAKLQGDLTRIQGQYETSKYSSEEQTGERGELLAARQSLTEEMERLLADYNPPASDAPVGGIPVDSEYLIFVIDTSGSMYRGAWDKVLELIEETLDVYPTVKGIQVLNDEGVYMFRNSKGRWLKDSPSMRRTILNGVRSFNAFSDSSPVEGIAEAIATFYDPDEKVSIFVYGDDFPRGSVEAVVRYVDRENKADRFGNRLMRIHAVGFPTMFQMKDVAGRDLGRPNRIHFANLMRSICERNGGSFVALTEGASSGGFNISIGGGGL